MTPRFIHLATALLVLATGPMNAQEATNSAPAAGQSTNAVTALDFPSFQVISRQNIFDPNRRPRRPSTPINFAPPAQVDSFSLKGTMSYDNQRVALFVSSSSQFNKAVTTTDSIAGYKIAEIAFDHVKLAAASNQTINLPVGSLMKRQDNGPWSLVETPETPVESNTAASPEKPADTSSRSSAIDDVIKRLMQKREQEK